jgi:hypothetical protein
LEYSSKLQYFNMIKAQLVGKQWCLVIASLLYYHESDTPWLILQHKDGDGHWFLFLALNSGTELKQTLPENGLWSSINGYSVNA